ncbi:MAG: hypothetical protein K8S16_01310 [Bacteroidales bacterium]|nr:hypothetical protein [Bacteroidales bacterium]
MEIFFLIGFIQALFFSILLFNKKTKILPEKMLPFWLFLIAIHLLLLFFLYRSLNKEYYILVILHITFPLIHYPLFYLYVNTLVNKANNLKLSHLLYFVPYFIFLIIHIIFSNHDLLYSYDFSQSNITPPNIIHFNLILNFISGLIYMVLCIMQLKKFNKKIKEYYSNIDKINLKWLAHLIIGFCTVLMIGIAYVMVTKWLHIKINYSIDIFIYGSITIFIFFIGYYSLKKTHLIIGRDTNSETDTMITNAIKDNPEKYYKYEIYGLKKDEAAKLKDKLLLFIDRNKPYLDCNLSLSQLAGSLGIYKHYLTQVLNDELKNNFYDFINNRTYPY